MYRFTFQRIFYDNSHLFSFKQYFINTNIEDFIFNQETLERDSFLFVEIIFGKEYVTFIL